MGMETTLKNSVLIAIFSICIVTFAVTFAIDNDSDVTLSGDSSFRDLNSSLQSTINNNLSDDADSSYEILLKTSLDSGDQEIAGGGGQFKIGPWTAWSLTIKSLNSGFKTIFGPEFNFILAAFVSLFIFLIGYYIIKAWLGKDPS